jgi:hypothetical protein
VSSRDSLYIKMMPTTVPTYYIVRTYRQCIQHTAYYAYARPAAVQAQAPAGYVAASGLKAVTKEAVNMEARCVGGRIGAGRRPQAAAAAAVVLVASSLVARL